MIFNKPQSVAILLSGSWLGGTYFRIPHSCRQHGLTQLRLNPLLLFHAIYRITRIRGVCWLVASLWLFVEAFIHCRNTCHCVTANNGNGIENNVRYDSEWYWIDRRHHGFAQDVLGNALISHYAEGVWLTASIEPYISACLHPPEQSPYVVGLWHS